MTGSRSLYHVIEGWGLGDPLVSHMRRKDLEGVGRGSRVPEGNQLELSYLILYPSNFQGLSEGLGGLRVWVVWVV